MIQDIILTEQITIHPNQLNNNLIEVIQSIIKKKVVGRCNDEQGYILELVNIISIQNGHIVNETGNIIYNVAVKVKTFQVDKDELIQGIVFKIDNKGLFAQSGPFEIYVSSTKIPPRYTFKDNKYVSSTDTIELNSLINIKVIGKKLSTTTKMIVGTIM